MKTPDIATLSSSELDHAAGGYAPPREYPRDYPGWRRLLPRFEPWRRRAPERCAAIACF